MSTLADLRPGDILFANRVRPLAADLLILAGQLTLGQPGYPHHVAVVTQAQLPTTAEAAPFGRLLSSTSGQLYTYPKIVQAMPSGAEEIEIGAEHWTSDYIYVRPAYGTQPGHTHGQGQETAWRAQEYIGTPYSFVDYAAIAAHHLSGEGYAPIEKRNRLQRYVASSKRMICSQLADQAMADAGFHVFNDRRLPQDVTPSALHSGLLALPGTLVLHPGDRDDGWFPETS
jgi:hypothetical protein